ncbi:hypothetical protein KFK14_17750 [Sphingobium phenoxybenzoativorans]|uniref:Lysis protein n=1 Tax=Sphingobium phenoxybenzoativorans TaxID=1592790 RepID=A0A975Q0Q5_9SPHN|nr:hypothetical protein [Sphingobium phenoxybenzoativorans]QUT04856.1 hypothetical protein KFK14_17750 [Sphingobium phenoxybenzoativorans]
MNIFSVLSAKIFGGAAIALALGLTVQTVRLAWEQTHSAKIEGDLKWAREERRAFEVAIIDKTATAFAQNKLAALTAEKNANLRIKEAQDERDKALADDIAHVDDRLQSAPTIDCSAPSAPGVARYPILSAEPLQGRLAIVDEPDVKACTTNARNLDLMIRSWENLREALAQP